MGIQLPLLKGHSPQFSANVRCGQTAGWTKVPLGVEVGLVPGTLFSMGAQLPAEKMAQPHPIFDPCLLRSNGWMHQDATCYDGKPRNRRRCVRWGCSYSTLKGAKPPVFGSRLLWLNGWMDEDATWYGSRHRPRPQCVTRGSRSTRNGHSCPPLFGSCLLLPRSPISASAQLLFNFHLPSVTVVNTAANLESNFFYKL